jgi:hypothetical protein
VLASPTLAALVAPVWECVGMCGMRTCEEVDPVFGADPQFFFPEAGIYVDSSDHESTRTRASLRVAVRHEFQGRLVCFFSAWLITFVSYSKVVVSDSISRGPSVSILLGRMFSSVDIWGWRDCSGTANPLSVPDSS